MKLAEDVKADLLVVGNVGLSTIAGRLLGSVPANVSRRAKVDVLIVHTTLGRGLPARRTVPPNPGLPAALAPLAQVRALGAQHWCRRRGPGR